MLAGSAFSDPPTVEALTRDFTPILIDVDQDAARADAYRIRRLPTVVFADHDGNSVGKFTGVPPPSDVRAAAERALERIE